jgi:hypothetical protein
VIGWPDAGLGAASGNDSWITTGAFVLALSLLCAASLRSVVRRR